MIRIGRAFRGIRWRFTAAMAGLLAATVLAFPFAGEGQDRLVRGFSIEDELLPPILALAQDSTGFLWAGTRAGLFRFDGSRFQRWVPDQVPHAIGTLATSPRGRVVAVDRAGRILELLNHGVRELPGRTLRSPDHTQVAAFDEEERLWIVGADGLVAWQASPDGWQTLPPAAIQGDTARKLFPGGPRGGVFLAGGDGLWHLHAERLPVRLLDGHLLVDLRTTDDGTVYALAVSSDVIRIPPSGPSEVVEWGREIPVTRAIGIEVRDGAIWVGTDRYLFSLGEDGVGHIHGPLDGVVAGGPLLVDREGSLWHGGFTQLAQYPEPSTMTWRERHGLQSDHARFLARTGDVVWVTTWQGPALIERAGGQWQAGVDGSWVGRDEMCAGGDGQLRIGTSEGLVTVSGRQTLATIPSSTVVTLNCRPASDGGFWMGTSEGLFHLSSDGKRLVPIASLRVDSGGATIHMTLEDSAGRLWVNSYRKICQAPAEAVLRRQSVTWACQDLPEGVVHLNGMAEAREGVIWAASSTEGVFHHAEGDWFFLQETETLPTRSVLNLVPSPRGGIWLVGAGILQRVEPTLDGQGWTVIERLGGWQGVPSVGGGDLLEDDDGTLWIATAQGVTRVPAHLRQSPIPPPQMALVGAFVDEEELIPGEEQRLRADTNRLELRFAALTFRDPSRVRFQVRLSPRDAWTDTGREPSFTWVNLPSGSHRPQVRASLDGLHWSSEPAEFPFFVAPPWYRQPLALAGFLALLGLLLFLFYRMRLAYHVGLERQRTRIAMDLHDEMGSGLASIGILAALLSDSPAQSPEGQQLARDVATTADGLGSSLSDIVWSLDPRSSTLDELASRLAERGERLFANGVTFDTEFPEPWPANDLALPILRNVFLVGLEAMNNAARHAGASRVVLRLLPGSGDWVLAVCDDGSGRLPGGADAGAGRGLRTMRRRAEEIHGEIAWDARPGEGTTVTLRFPSALPGGWRPGARSPGKLPGARV